MSCSPGCRLLVLGALAVVLGVNVWPSKAEARDGVAFTARLDGRDVAESSDRRPIRLDPSHPIILELEVENTGTSPAQVRAVQLNGRVIGLTFFSYETEVVIPISPGATVTRRFSLHLRALKGQATGLIPASVELLDGRRKVVASSAAVVDVRGSLWSVYGLFGLAVTVVTVVLMIRVGAEIAGHRQHPNRWRRATRFLPIGAGAGLFVIFTLSALRVLAPGAGRWIPILLIGVGAAFVVGYSTPKPKPVPTRLSASP